MRRFLRDVAVFLLLQAALFAALDAAYMHRVGREHYLASFLDKTRRLEQTPSPRILLVGGSSTSFGVNSAALERVTGRPVVNLGLNAGLGLRFMLAQASAAVGPGDLVVVIPEYSLFVRGELVDARTMMLLLRIAPHSARFLPPAKVPQLLDEGLSTVTQRLRTMWSVLRGTYSLDPKYRRQAFDERGDVTAHLALHSRRGGDQHVSVPMTAEAEPACRHLEAFGRHASVRGARVVIVPPPIPGDDYAAQEQQVIDLWGYVGRQSGIEVAGVGNKYGRGHFLDTSYHLTKAGRRAYSRNLIRLLRSRLTAPLSAGHPADSDGD